MRKFIFILILLGLTGFKKQEYKFIDKEIDGRTFHFAIPSSFCEYKSKTPEIMEFMKCYEMEMEKNRVMPFYSEKIFIAVEKDDKRVQNITDRYFATIQKDLYKNMPKEKKEQYFYNENYPFKNKAKSRVVDDKYVFSRTASSEDGYRFITYQSNLFLNKRYFMINWTQYLTKNEKLLELTEKKFVNFVEENRRLNDYQHSLYKYPTRQIIFTKPRFGNFGNYMNIKEYNDGNFTGVFKTMLSKKDKKDMLTLGTSVIYTNTDAKKYFEELSNKKEQKEFDVELVRYKDDDFVKVTTEGRVVYLCYINFSYNLTGVVSLALPEGVSDKKNSYVEYLYKYKQQLIEDNL